MNTLILMMLFLILFDLPGVFDFHEEVIVNDLCFLSALSFGYYLANLKRSHSLTTKQLNDDLIFFLFRVTIIKMMSIHRSKHVPKYTPPKERDFFLYLDDLKFEETMRD